MDSPDLRVHFYYSPYLFLMDDNMNASKLLLESLKNYQVENVFGLPGETTLPLYKEWLAEFFGDWK